MSARRRDCLGVRSPSRKCVLYAGSALAILAAAPSFAQDAASSAPRSDASSPTAPATDQTTPSATQATAQPPASPVAQAAADAQPSGGAQDTTDGDVVITGIKASIAASLTDKREALNFVDTIHAEDIGKYPNNNLAEALQRIPGVTITRNHGEGKNISVRGLGDGYNVTTLNGMRMASDADSRDFNYDLLAADLVSSVEVYKTPLANLPEGATGAQVNIITRRPLDRPGFHFDATADADYHTTSRKWNPEASFVASDTFADGTFGVLVTGAYSRKSTRTDDYYAQYYGDARFQRDGDGNAYIPYDKNGDGHINSDTDGDGIIDHGEKVIYGDKGEYYVTHIPGYVQFYHATDQQTRIGFNGALQWKPSSNWEITLQGLYTQYHDLARYNVLSFVNFADSNLVTYPKVSNVKFASDGGIESATFQSTPLELQDNTTPRRSYTFQANYIAGWHNDADTLSATVNAAYSKARDRNNGESRNAVARDYYSTYTFDMSNAGNGSQLLPDITFDQPLTPQSPFLSHDIHYYGIRSDDRVKQARLDLKYTPKSGFLKSLMAGVDYVTENKGHADYNAVRWSAFGNLASLVKGGAMTQAQLDGLIASGKAVFVNGQYRLVLPSDAFGEANFKDFLSGEKGLPSNWPSVDADTLLAYYNSISPTGVQQYLIPQEMPANSYSIAERTLAPYVRATMGSTIFHMPFVIDAGVRFPITHVSSHALTYDLQSAQIDPVTGTVMKLTTVPTSYAGHTFYPTPSATFKLNLTDRLIFRSSASYVTSRPALTDLTAYVSGINYTTRSFNQNDPSLSPYRTIAIDGGLEWYMSRTSALTVAFYDKQLTGFPINVIRDVTINGITWHDHTKVATGKAYIKGIEIGVNQSFDPILPQWAHGFGFSGNALFVDSAFKGDLAGGTPFPGLSEKSYNIDLYYENHGFAIHLTRNWRSKYIDYIDHSASYDAYDNGGSDYVAAYGQWDLGASYNFSKHFGVTFNISNITNARYYSYVGTPGQLSQLEHSGTRYYLGARAHF